MIQARSGRKALPLVCGTSGTSTAFDRHDPGVSSGQLGGDSTFLVNNVRR